MGWGGRGGGGPELENLGYGEWDSRGPVDDHRGVQPCIQPIYPPIHIQLQALLSSKEHARRTFPSIRPDHDDLYLKIMVRPSVR